MPRSRTMMARAAVAIVALAFSAAIAAQQVTSPMTGTTQGRAPAATGLFISNQSRPGHPPKVGEVLQANNYYSDADADPSSGTTLQWFRAGAPISGAVNSTYTTVAADANQNLSVQVTPRSDPASTDPAIGLPATASAVLVHPNPLANVLRINPLRRWNLTSSLCSTGRVATPAELQAIFVAATSATVANGSQGNDEMCSLHGWPLGHRCGGPPDDAYNYYWTSDAYVVVSMLNGRSTTTDPTSQRYSVCVR